jgi:hypothetical protein
VQGRVVAAGIEDGRAAIRKITDVKFLKGCFMPATHHSKQESGYGCLTRLCWMLFGNIALIVSGIVIMGQKNNFVSYADFAFWLIVLFLIGVRYVDITKMEGTTASEKPATIKDWRRYTIFLLIFSLILWGISHAISRFS